MKVLLVNGSPHKEGCTHAALSEVAKSLNKNGIDTEIFRIGTKPISGCVACLKCNELKKCVFDDVVNEFTEKAREADGFIFGSPVHYAGATGAITSFMDRAFYSGFRGGTGTFRLKPAACVVSARRAGTTATFDQLNKYFTISEMPIVSSRYWNMVHGANPDDVAKDEEGLLTCRVLGENMSYMLRCIEVAKKHGVTQPVPQTPVFTNFIRAER
ncbi:MAG: flavodoxin family protein [Clostridiales Family XIII bacterium]|jgi:multimeric flavodoxin WrbA|nr:flavodoxin family protein [Clostridiales Family XIII bacterium]